MHQKRVLIADDNSDAAQSLGMVLAFWGHEVRCACNGEEAVEMARGFKPDLVILDINMPVMDGYEAARTLRREAGGPLLLVALTAAPARETPLKAQASGFDAHFGKPMDAEDLAALLHRIS